MRCWAPGVVARHIESEWALPIENTQEAVKWISENMEEAFGNNAFEVHVRFVPADGAHLSPAHGRETVYIDINITVTIGYSLEPFYVRPRLPSSTRFLAKIKCCNAFVQILKGSPIRHAPDTLESSLSAILRGLYPSYKCGSACSPCSSP